LPYSSEALRMHLRWATRISGHITTAQRILTERFPTFPTKYDDLLLYARAYDELKLFTEADMAFEAAIRLKPETEGPHLAYTRALHARGSVKRAFEAIERAEHQGIASDQLTRLKVTIDLERHLLGAVSPAAGSTQRVSDAVLIELLDKILERRKSIDLGSRSYIGPVFMLNGSLGPGGAERQLMNTAIGLQECIDKGHRLDGRDVIGPVTVCVRSLTNRRDAGFFAPALKSAGVQVVEYSTFEAYGGNRRHSLAGGVADLLHFLPHQMIEGTERLTDIIAGQRPDVVHIWQDGTIFATALAALLADVPRIVLNVRTAPPIDRPTRMKPEYSVLYPRLVKMPGVVLTANSRYAAHRYADWLGIDPTSIPVVYNGLRPLPATGDAKAQDLLRTFNARTAGHDFTVGTVMRFDENKRPYAWLESVAELLSRCPSVRFIMVGDGPLYTAAIEYAEMLKITHRVLFAGHSDQVGFWLNQFDGFLLLSVFEGLPNVLIESQFAGVPVVSTPAGGAAETMIQGQTGLVLDTGDEVDTKVVAEKLLLLRGNADQKPAVAALANRWVREQFSIEQMLQATARVYLR
jgi:glycosyltransferase involved in cell wall biosynthesis